MKTETREFWVSKGLIKKMRNGTAVGYTMSDECSEKITISYSVEPLKVTISEDEFDELFPINNGIYGHYKMIKDMKDKLFGAKE